MMLTSTYSNKIWKMNKHSLIYFCVFTHQLLLSLLLLLLLLLLLMALINSKLIKTLVSLQWIWRSLFFFQDNALKEWSFKKAITIQTYSSYHPIPVPLNLVSHLILFIRCLRQICARKCTGIPIRNTRRIKTRVSYTFVCNTKDDEHTMFPSKVYHFFFL